MELTEKQRALMDKFIASLPEINAAQSYGQATEIVRKNIDPLHGIQPDKKGNFRWEARISFSGSAIIQVEAKDEDEAREAVKQEIDCGVDTTDIDDFEIDNIKRIGK